ncbi:aldolase [Baekduia soli]|uniref:Aldolase n=1 Tax=Baekduia soli TaxID=496014 RepID=A0A5B8U3R5_9ACTN|nr:aldolase/citrate lyase family protein [Baekduia soli]QEC47571.1 aldolase [Baekduia soli]
MRENAVKRTLDAGGVSIGTFVAELATPNIGRLAASAGVDFMVIDQEHTGLTLESVKTIVSASRSYDLTPIVRVPDAQYHLIAGALDVGAMGIMVPQVETVEEAEQIVSWAKYPPAGERGCGIYYPDLLIEGGLGATELRHNDQTQLIIQIESVKGVEAVHELAAIEGIDVLWIGAADLTTTMGIPGQFDDPRYLEALQTVASAAQAAGKVAGMLSRTTDEAQLLLDLGYRMISHSADLWLYAAALKTGVDELRALTPGAGR